jgi:membrane protein YdbS with pleckstrin-like domain
MTLLSSFDGLLWLALILVLLVFLQRWLHREVQAVFLVLTHRLDVTAVVFSLIFIPGIFLHELSHFVMARLLRVRTGRFSITPQRMPDGMLRLGYVEISRGGMLRDSLIGAAPLVTGCLLVAYAAGCLEMPFLWDLLRHGQFGLFWRGIATLPTVQNFWLWFYLTFVVSSTMMPSTSDRHAWLPLGLLVGGLFGVTLLAGAGPWMLEHLAGPVNDFLKGLAAVFGLSAAVHVVSTLPFALIHRLLSRLTGVDVT